MEPIQQAVKILRRGGLVAFPTETVYGLGADATNSTAVRKIFAAKGRPPTNPLIVHIADAAVARRFASHWPSQAQHLADAFWPGPLTIVLPKNSRIVDEATAGRNTVGLRAPNHPLANQLLRSFGGPLAAPSANRSTGISPTTADHVHRDLGDRVDLILDGGPCEVGIESTVIDLTTPKPIILRPGAIGRRQIESLIGAVAMSDATFDSSQSAPAPGMQAVHYAPRKPAFRIDPSRLAGAKINDSIFLISIRKLETGQRIQMPTSPEDYARQLYAALHQADQSPARTIYIEMPPDTPAWYAVRDRILRATSPHHMNEHQE